MKHFSNNAKEYMKIQENNGYRQGRSPQQMESNYIGAFVSICALGILIICHLLTKLF